jgi:Carboxypeptidase regulatory-like domain
MNRRIVRALGLLAIVSSFSASPQLFARCGVERWSFKTGWKLFFKRAKEISNWRNRMKPRFGFTAVVLFFMIGVSGNCQQQSSGDIWRWIAFDGGATGKESQIVRNTQYVSIKIAAAHVSYKSGFLENIKQIVVSSNVSFDLPGQKVEALTINRTWQKSKKSDDDIPANDLLAVLSPASPSNINVRMAFAGIGEDRFKSIFDLLASSDVKTALNLSPASIAQAGLITSVVQKFLATPYTSSNPRDVLSMSQGFVIHSDKDIDRSDSLRQGYLVVISGSENKSNDLSRVIQLGSEGLRFDPVYHILQFKAPDGSWQSFAGNSYVVLSINVDPVRGTDESSAWFKKFSEADRTTEDLLTGATLDSVKKNALALWQEGSTLLSADPNYIETERKNIRLKAIKDIQDDLKKNGASLAEANLAVVMPGVPVNFSQIAKDYEAQVQSANLGADVILHVRDARGKAISGARVAMKDTITGRTQNITTDQAGDAVLQSLQPATYQIEAARPGFAVTSLTNVVVQPRETKELNLTFPR